MTLVRQPASASLCGQACLAMAAGITIHGAVTAVGHSKARGTDTKEIVAAFDRLGIPCDRRMRRIRHVAGMPVLAQRCMVSIRHNTWKPNHWHWLLWWDGAMADPDDLWPEYYGSDWRITSQLKIYTPAPSVSHLCHTAE